MELICVVANMYTSFINKTMFMCLICECKAFQKSFMSFAPSVLCIAYVPLATVERFYSSGHEHSTAYMASSWSLKWNWAAWFTDFFARHTEYKLCCSVAMMRLQHYTSPLICVYSMQDVYLAEIAELQTTTKKSNRHSVWPAKHQHTSVNAIEKSFRSKECFAHK